jgi:hypothetical protein
MLTGGTLFVLDESPECLEMHRVTCTVSDHRPVEEFIQDEPPEWLLESMD